MENIVSKNKGITIIALIITIILALILFAIVIEYGKGEIEKAKIEDIKTTMLLIQGRAKISIDKIEFETDYEEEGVIQLNSNLTLPEEATLQYNLSSLTSVLNSLEDKSNLYIWEQQAMDNNGIDIEVTAEEFYVIDYNTQEIYYSLGYKDGENIYYSLSQLQEL